MNRPNKEGLPSAEAVEGRTFVWWGPFDRDNDALERGRAIEHLRK